MRLTGKLPARRTIAVTTAAGLLASGLALQATGPAAAVGTDDVRVTSADFFRGFVGAFLDVEARTDAPCDEHACPTLTVELTTDGTTWFAATPSTMTADVDAGEYVKHRLLVRLSDHTGTSTTVRPVTVRVSSSAGGAGTRQVQDFLVPQLPPHVHGFIKEFFFRYMTPTEGRNDLDALAARYPELMSVVNLPEKSTGFQRHAQAALGCSVGPASVGNSELPGSPGATPAGFQTPSVCSPSQADRAVVLTSKDWGHEGGNVVTAVVTVPPVVSSPLSVDVFGQVINVSLATDASGAAASAASQVVDAINASPAASALVTARTYGDNPGAGVVLPTTVRLSDFLWAPESGEASAPRGPFQGHLYRIGARRDGSRPAVLIFAGLEADSWLSPLVAVETAHELVENYAQDPETKTLLDDVEIFIVPYANPDGMNLSLLNGAPDHTKNMTETCRGTASGVPANRDSWGVDLQHNFAVGSAFDGYAPAVGACGSAHFAGTHEFSEPDSRNLKWITDTFPNIRFAADVDGSGGYVLWPPGSYTQAGRAQLPGASLGVDQWYRSTARRMITAMSGQGYGGVWPPGRVGPAADTTLGSRAGNPVDQLFYDRGVLAVQLRCGPDRFDPFSATSNTGTPLGLHPPLQGQGQGHAAVIECAEGLYALVAAARAYAVDGAAPVVDAVPVPGGQPDQVVVRFTGSEPADVYYTTDGSTPTLASTRYEAAGIGERDGRTLTFTEKTTLRWLAVDVRGNTSAVRTQVFSPTQDVTPPVVTPDVSGTAGSDGWYRGDVTVSWVVDDPESPITSPTCAATSITADTFGQTVTCSATSTGGTTVGSVTVKRDATPPTVVLGAHPTSYTVDKRVTISCTANDLVSGLPAPCAALDVPAASLAVGTNTMTRTAVDRAGNSTTVSTTFVVAVSVGGVATLTGQYVQGSARYQALTPVQRRAVDALTTAAVSFLTAIEPRLTAKQRAALVTAYTKAVNDLVNRGWLTSAQGTTLVGLVRTL